MAFSGLIDTLGHVTFSNMHMISAICGEEKSKDVQNAAVFIAGVDQWSQEHQGYFNLP